MARFTPIDPSMLTVSVRKRFYALVALSPNGCHEWQGAMSTLGYGRFNLGGKYLSPHRLIFVMQTGKPIPEGMVVDHLCRNHSCLNIDHLELVSYAENTARGKAPNAAAIRARLDSNECVNGHSLAEFNGQRCLICVRAYSVAQEARRKVDPAFKAAKSARMVAYRARKKAEANL